MLDRLEKFAHSVLSIGIMLVSVVVTWAGYRAGMAVITPDVGPVTNLGTWYLAIGAMVALSFGAVNFCYGFWSLVSRERWLAFVIVARDQYEQGHESNWYFLERQNVRHLLWMLVCGAWAIAGFVNLLLAEHDEMLAGNALDSLWLQGRSAMVLGINLLAVTALFISGLTWLRDKALEYIILANRQSPRTA